jgi:hypothetical protein
MSKSVPKTAMVLAAGLGTRLKPHTDERPKPLMEVLGKPLLDHALDRLAEAGVETAIVNTHHLADQLERHLATRERPRILISHEPTILAWRHRRRRCRCWANFRSSRSTPRSSGSMAARRRCGGSPSAGTRTMDGLLLPDRRGADP